MESQTATTKNVSRKNTKKNETEVAAATVVAAPAETTTTEKKKASRAKKTETETIVETKSEEVATPVSAESETAPAVSDSPAELIARAVKLAEESAQLTKDIKTMKEFETENVKEFYTNFDKTVKNVASAQTHMTNLLLKEVVASEKQKQKKTKKAEKTPSDPSSHPLNTPRNTLPFVLKAMGKADGEQVSRNEVQKFVNQLIKDKKDSDYQVKINGEVQKSIFYINKGALGEFFKNIQAEIKKRGFKQEQVDMGYFDKDGNLPEHIQYKMLMGYVSYCFPPTTA